MLPFDPKSREAGVSLTEMMIATAISAVFVYGGIQMLGRFQKYLAYKDLNKVGRNEAVALSTVLKKDWDFRIIPKTAGVTEGGYELKSANNGPCTDDCPKLLLWIKRPIDGVKVIDKLLIENICVRPQSGPVMALAIKVPFNNPNIINAKCGGCPSGDVPAVQLSAVDINNNNRKTLAAENRVFPQNVAQSLRADPGLRKDIIESGVLGMQACFSQSAPDAPLHVDVRSIVLAQGLDKNGVKVLQKIQNTQIFPFQNFANIKLEQ